MRGERVQTASVSQAWSPRTCARGARLGDQHAAPAPASLNQVIGPWERPLSLLTVWFGQVLSTRLFSRVTAFLSRLIAMFSNGLIFTKTAIF